MKRSNLFWMFNFLHGFALIAFACQTEPQILPTPIPPLESEVADGYDPYSRLSTDGFFEGNMNKLQPAEHIVIYQLASSPIML